MAETQAAAEAAFDAFVESQALKYEKAADCLAKDRDALLAFYDFPAEHWKHLRTTNPIESTFATVRHRTIRSKFSLLYMHGQIFRSGEKGTATGLTGARSPLAPSKRANSLMKGAATSVLRERRRLCEEERYRRPRLRELGGVRGAPRQMRAGCGECAGALHDPEAPIVRFERDEAHQPKPLGRRPSFGSCAS